MKSSIAVVAVASLLSTGVLATTNQQVRAGQANFASTQAQQNTATAQNAPVNINDVSYSFGYMMGSNMQRQSMDLNIDQFIIGMKQALAGQDGKFNHKQMIDLLTAYQNQLRAKQAQLRKQLAEQNKKKSDEFWAANKSQNGIITLPSGLQYRIIQAGNGNKPTQSDNVAVTYSGKLLNGDQFASSEDENNPAKFALNQVIPGWREALQLMKTGATWELYVPPQLAYGVRGTHGKIGPNETLIFRIKLLNVEKADSNNANNTNNATKPAAAQSALQNNQRTNYQHNNNQNT